MAITLEESKVGMADKVDIAVVDEFRRNSKLMDMLIFDNSVSPGTSGSTLTYGYLQLKTPSTAAKRTINSEYTAGEAKKEKKSADLAIMGGKYTLDRVIINTSGALDELAFQQAQKIKATANYFHYTVVNGVKATDGFDGLKTLLAGTQNEITSDVDISTADKMTTNAQGFLDELDTLVASIEGGATALLMNRKMLTKVRGVARRAGYYTRSENSAGEVTEYYSGIPMLDLGKYYNGSKAVDVVPIENYKTAIYAIRIGLDAFHGVTPVGDKIISQYTPDLTLPGAVKEGEVEFVGAVVLKNTLTAGVLKDITIDAAAG